MNNYSNSYTSEWSTPDAMKRYSMYLTPKGKRRERVLPLRAGPGETKPGSPRGIPRGLAWEGPGLYLPVV